MRIGTPFGASLRRDRHRLLCACRGALTYTSYETFRSLLAAVAGHRHGEVVLDFGGLDFLDSNGLGMLLVLKDKACERGSRVRLVNVPPRVEKVLTTTGMRQMLEG
ncbi:MAG TPA: STAS domain-containing protein [Azospirillum sp.]|nr:STAS domain-containing protein [Azospirillum sp.]